MLRRPLLKLVLISAAVAVPVGMAECGTDTVTPFTTADDNGDKFDVKLTSPFQHTPFAQQFTPTY